MRRNLVLTAGGWGLGCAVPRNAARPRAPRLRGVLFDAFPVFDPRHIGEQVQKMFPEQGRQLLAAWRRRQFEYTWLRASAEQYDNFWRCTEAALTFAAHEVGVELSAGEQSALMQSYLTLPAWPDAEVALTELRALGLQLGFLSNFTPKMLRACARHARVLHHFDQLLSTDRVRTFKPAPAAYALGERSFGMGRHQLLFVAFAGWDIVGAKWFGYPSFWVNRLGAPPEHLGERPDGTGSDLLALVEFITTRYG